MSNVKGFTILEVIIALTVSTLVLGIATTAYFFATKQFNLFSGKSNTCSEINRFSYTLKRDIDKCDKIILLGDNHLSLVHKTTPINYTLHSNYCIRSSITRNDTFALTIQNEFQNKIQGTDIINAIQFSVFSEQQKVVFSFNKKYGADILLNTAYQ